MTTLRAALLSLPLLVTSTALAQEALPVAPQPSPVAAPAAPSAPTAEATAPVQRGRVGLGVSLGLADGGQALYVPVDLGAVRFELEGAYRERDVDGAAATSTRLGVGVFSLIDTSVGTREYLGVRLQYLRAAVGGDGAEGVRGAAVLGAEWSPTPALALGVEGQLGGQASRKLVRAGTAGGTYRGVDASAGLFLRVFLASFDAGSGAPARAGARGGPTAPPPPGRCQVSSDCQGLGICYDGTCRR